MSWKFAGGSKPESPDGSRIEQQQIDTYLAHTMELCSFNIGEVSMLYYHAEVENFNIKLSWHTQTISIWPKEDQLSQKS